MPFDHVERRELKPLNFEEYLWAVGIPERSIDEIKRCIRCRIPLEEPSLDAIVRCHRDYMIVGGMPGSVQSLIDTDGFAKPEDVKNDILRCCYDDIFRYSGYADASRVERCMDSIPSQLCEKNKKFTFSRLNGIGGRMSYRGFADCIRWISESGYGIQCPAVSDPISPLESRVQQNAFKLFLSDTGLLVSRLGNAMRAVFKGDLSYLQGAVAENAVAEGLVKSGLQLHHFRRTACSGKISLDFIMELGHELTAVEVDSGRGRDYPSMSNVHRFQDVKRRIVFGDTDIHVDEDGVEHYPLFASAFADCMTSDSDETVNRRTRCTHPTDDASIIAMMCRLNRWPVNLKACIALYGAWFH